MLSIKFLYKNKISYRVNCFADTSTATRAYSVPLHLSVCGEIKSAQKRWADFLEAEMTDNSNIISDQHISNEL